DYYCAVWVDSLSTLLF
nr:immunoglobulin light chain junction region [Macaca mulatta]